MLFNLRITYLIILIEPEKCQVSNTNRLPVIRYLLPSTINNVSDFVRNHKLQVLKYEKVKAMCLLLPKQRIHLL
jgi:hypothetical protein